MKQSDFKRLQELRAEVGLPPLERREYKCMRCDAVFKAIHRRARCANCEKALIRNGVITKSCDDFVEEDE